MRQPRPQPGLEDDICIYIFSMSAAMVGVCLTVIGLIRIVIELRKVGTIADDLLCVDALLFLLTCALAYWALRTRTIRRRQRVERVADALFMSALSLMVVVCLVVTYAITST
jgi:hypothetical protein